MIKRSLVPMLLLTLVMLCAVLPIGCSNSEDPPPPPPGCDITLAMANDSLAALMDVVRNDIVENADSSFRPNDIDFTGVYNMYQDVLTCEPTNKGAMLGSAFSGLMTFLQDPDLNAIVNDFKSVYDTLSFNPLNPAKTLPYPSIGGGMFPSGIPSSGRGFTNLLVDAPKLENRAMAAAAGKANFSDIQANFRDKLLPKVKVARDLMLDIIADPAFTFEISPAMQGNAGADKIIMDISDFRVFAATLYALEAGIEIFLSRTYDLPAYTAANLEQAMSQSSSFLNLTADGGTRMVAARDAILSGESQLELAISSLISEIGSDQSSDLIAVYESDRKDLNTILDSLKFYRTYFNGPKLMTIRWHDWVPYDTGYVWGIDSIQATVDVSKFFEAPMNNPKQFLPAYTVTVDEYVEDFPGYAAAHFSRTDYWNSLDTIFGITYPNDAARFGVHLPDTDTDQFYKMIGDTRNYPQCKLGWDDVYFGWYGGDPTNLSYYWSSNQNTYWYSYYREADKLYVCYTWTAGSYDTWNFPNPTFNGLLPGMTADQLRTKVFDHLNFTWRKSDCGYISTHSRIQ